MRFERMLCFGNGETLSQKGEDAQIQMSVIGILKLIAVTISHLTHDCIRGTCQSGKAVDLIADNAYVSSCTFATGGRCVSDWNGCIVWVADGR